MKAQVLLIVPAYRESKSLPIVVADLRKHYPEGDILVVNDASPDDTAEVAKSLGVSVISLPINLGIGGAVQTGIQWAVIKGYKVAVQFDGDGQHQAKYIRNLVAPVLLDAQDLMIGSRFMKNQETGFKTSLPRRTGMILFSAMLRTLTGKIITDTTSGFRAYGPRTMKYFFENYPVDFPDMPAILAVLRLGFRVEEIPVEMNQRQFGVSTTNLWKSIWYPFKTMAVALSVYLREEKAK